MSNISEAAVAKATINVEFPGEMGGINPNTPPNWATLVPNDGGNENQKGNWAAVLMQVSSMALLGKPEPFLLRTEYLNVSLSAGSSGVLTGMTGYILARSEPKLFRKR